ncbi:MAG: hypothetical protein IJW40_06160 [Clostridia bacterium]|nr:hypothetical protein [Clostridia bacterium]
MKKILVILLALLSLTMVFSLLACNNEPAPPDEGDDTPPEAMTDIVIDGASSYTLVRSDRYNTSDPITQAAVDLRKAVEAATGCSLGITTDYTAPVALEIIVGDTNREENALIPTDLALNEYVIIHKDGKLIISGSDGTSTSKAVEYFIKTYLGYDAATGTYAKTTLSIPESLNYRGSFDYPTIVYQIGDIKSIPTASGNEVYNDVVRLITSLQGRLNKNAEENGFYIYQMYDSTDSFWLEYISGEGKMFDGAIVVELKTWADFWEVFAPYIQEAGLVAWDPEVPSTANVAATICALDGYLPVRFSSDESSLYKWLRNNGVATAENLYGMFDGTLGTKIADTNLDSSGSAKCDAYLWALEKYGDRCNPLMVAYTLDGASTVADNLIYQEAEGNTPNWNQLYSHDFLIYNECFFFDLTCYAEEAPCDDPEQPIGTDAATLHTILNFFCQKNNGKMGKLMGFPPWYMKYTTHRGHGTPVATTLEWDFVEFISAYNFIKEADAAHPAWMTNGSVFTQYVSTTDYENTEVEPTEIFDSKTRYFTIYMGDYDSSAWLKQHIPNFFRDNGRGEYPLMWGFNPNLGDRVPMVFDYIYENLTENDILATGDSGAGYVIPAMLPNIDTWVAYNEPYTEKYDMDIVGFIINGNNPMTDREFAAYAEIAPIGSFHNDSSKKLVVWDNLTVYMHLMNGINPTDAKVAESMYNYASQTGNNFSAYRTVCYSPSSVNNAIEAFIEYAEAKNDGYSYMCVDPYTLFDLVLQSGQGDYRDAE